jgi:hypothetical protein
VRCQTAKCLSNHGRGIRGFKRDDTIYENFGERISDKDYMLYKKEQEEELVEKYKHMLKKTDFSISDKNIERTCELLVKMQKIATTQQTF